MIVNPGIFGGKTISGSHGFGGSGFGANGGGGGSFGPYTGSKGFIALWHQPIGIEGAPSSDNFGSLVSFYGTNSLSSDIQVDIGFRFHGQGGANSIEYYIYTSAYDGLDSGTVGDQLLSGSFTGLAGGTTSQQALVMASWDFSSTSWVRRIAVNAANYAADALTARAAMDTTRPLVEGGSSRRYIGLGSTFVENYVGAVYVAIDGDVNSNLDLSNLAATWANFAVSSDTPADYGTNGEIPSGSSPYLCLTDGGVTLGNSVGKKPGVQYPYPTGTVTNHVLGLRNVMDFVPANIVGGSGDGSPVNLQGIGPLDPP